MNFSTEQVDHLNVKIFAAANDVDLEPAIPMFHRWIQDSLLDELVIDVADYRHVPQGPGIMLIGHNSNYSLDLAFGRLGLLYNSKTPKAGRLQEKLQDGFGLALSAAALVEQDPGFANALRFDAGQCEMSFNDRLLVPNTDLAWDALQPELFRFASELFGDTPFSLTKIGEPRERLRVAISSAQPVPVKSLRERMFAVRGTP